MFILSQYILKQVNICNMNDITTYSIAIGLIIYTSIYLYLLFYNDEYLSIFNKFIIYIIAIDLLLSTFYYLNNDSNAKILEYKQADNKPTNENINENINANKDNTPIFNENDYDDTYSDTYSDSDSEELLSDNESFKNDEKDNDNVESNIIESEIKINEPSLHNIAQNKIEETNLEQQDTNTDIKMDEVINTIKSDEKNMNSNIVEDNFVDHFDITESVNKSDFDTKESDIITLQTNLEEGKITKKKRGRKPNSLKL